MFVFTKSGEAAIRFVGTRLGHGFSYMPDGFAGLTLSAAEHLFREWERDHILGMAGIAPWREHRTATGRLYMRLRQGAKLSNIELRVDRPSVEGVVTATMTFDEGGLVSSSLGPIYPECKARHLAALAAAGFPLASHSAKMRAFWRVSDAAEREALAELLK